MELTEEQQILLLEEYEKEIASKKNGKSRDIANNNANKQTKNKTDNTNLQNIDKKNKNVKSPKRAPKSDECGNNLVEDYFGDKEQVKDDASANSDESWEKEFEIEEPVKEKV